jgi:hypothetical protein
MLPKWLSRQWVSGIVAYIHSWTAAFHKFIKLLILLCWNVYWNGIDVCMWSHPSNNKWIKNLSSPRGGLWFARQHQMIHINRIKKSCERKHRPTVARAATGHCFQPACNSDLCTPVFFTHCFIRRILQCLRKIAYDFSFQRWAALIVEGFWTFRQTFQLPSSGWKSTGGCF